MFRNLILTGLLSGFLPCSNLAAASLQSRIVSNSTSRIGTIPCDALVAAGLSDRIMLATDSAYEERIGSYWSSTSQLRPWCIVQPHTAAEVSTALTVLLDAGAGAGSWHIAVRGGGHSFWAGVNNVANGVTIDLGYFNTSWYNSTTGLASVGPGERWADVAADLIGDGVVVPGGRDGDVGVGGFLLGGGNNYFASRVGFGCDNVVNYEVVLANGSIIDVNNQTYVDLFKALKGGTSNFGIVTRFDMQPIPAQDLWGGSIVSTKDTSDAVIDATIKYAQLPEADALDDSAIVIYVHNTTLSDEEYIIISALTNTQGVSNSTAFTDFRQLNSVSTSYAMYNMVDYLVAGENAGGERVTWYTLTFKANPKVLSKAVELFEEYIAAMEQYMPADAFMARMIWQALPTWFARDDNVLGLGSSLTENGVLWMTHVLVETAEQEAIAHKFLSASFAALQDYAESLDAGLDWIYLNYAHPSQDPLKSYGEDKVQFIREVAAKYDPTGVFQNRIPGGFKISRVV